MTPQETFATLTMIVIIWHVFAGIKVGKFEHLAQFVRTGIVFVLFFWHLYDLGIALSTLLLCSAATFVFIGNVFFQGFINLSYEVGSFIDPNESKYFDLLGKRVQKLFYGSGRAIQLVIGFILLALTFIWSN